MSGHHEFSRRRFLQSSAAAMAVPYFIPSGILAADGKPGANEQIGLAIVGCGDRGHQLAQNLEGIARLVAVCDCDSNKIASLLKQQKSDAKVYANYRKLMEDKAVDGVIVCPTDPHHILCGVLACQAGKDVYCEKPLSLYLKEGRELVKAARKYKRVVQTGTQQRTMEMDRFACEFVRDGGIGKIKYVECVNFTSPLDYPAEGLPEQPIPAGVDWDLWQGQAPVHPFNMQLFGHWTAIQGNWWGMWRDYAGRQITGLGAHAFDMVQYGLGMDDTGPVEFWPVEEGPQARLCFRYANGVEVRLTFADERPYRGPRNGAIFVGEKCKIEINRNKFVTNPKDFIKNPPDAKLAEKWEGDGWVAKGHIENWLDCMRSRAKPNADVEIGHRTASLCHLLNITRRLGRAVKWDPAKEISPDDAEVNKLIDRPRRKGWELPDLG